MTTIDTYRLKRIISMIEDLTLIKYKILPIDYLRKRYKYQLIELVMELQGKHNALVKALQDLLKESKWNQNN